MGNSFSFSPQAQLPRPSLFDILFSDDPDSHIVHEIYKLSNVVDEGIDPTENIKNLIESLKLSAVDYYVSPGYDNIRFVIHSCLVDIVVDKSNKVVESGDDWEVIGSGKGGHVRYISMADLFNSSHVNDRCEIVRLGQVIGITERKTYANSQCSFDHGLVKFSASNEAVGETSIFSFNENGLLLFHY